jgi:hypothetical protein
VIGCLFLLFTPLPASPGQITVPSVFPIQIERIASSTLGGHGYRLIYTVPVPLETYWRFKTDFSSDFLLTNKYIVHHRFIGRTGNTVITENAYSNSPGKVFLWETRVSSTGHRLDFVLLNPHACGQRFHRGHIIATPEGVDTRVVQEAYFDFFGAALWTIYPWSGGMRDFLVYTARWEYETVLMMREQYAR